MGVSETSPSEPVISGETEKQRLDRQLVELLSELRVALPGVQVLFAFLLAVPFAARFDQVTPFQEKVYFVTLLCTAVASALLIAPTAHHRIQFKQQDKAHIVNTANHLTVAGLGALALAMLGAVMLVTDFLFSSTATIVVSVVTGVVFAFFWYALPIARRLTRNDNG